MCVRPLTAIACFLTLVGPSCSNADNLALLLDTLKPVHRYICDDQPVLLICPTGTTISIVEAQYGENVNLYQQCHGEMDPSCKLPNILQYNLLQRVIEACQRKPSCNFTTNPGADFPCPSSRKFVEVTYKCRPFEFQSVNACYGQKVGLNCDPLSRIAIYDVHYGRNAHDPGDCPLPQGTPEESCTTPYAVETVMRICHGKRRCQFSASRSTIDTPCKPHIRPYIKIIYACVPLGVLIDRYESAVGRDPTDGADDVGVTDESFYDGEKWRGPFTELPAADPAKQLPTVITTVSHPREKGVINKPTNKEFDIFTNSTFLIFIGIGIIIIAIIIFIAVLVRCYYKRKAKEIAKNGEMFTTDAPNVFNDAASDIDNDVEVSHISGAFYDPVHPDMILYKDVDGTRNTLRAMRPLSTIYPCAGPRMYGNDYAPQAREFGKFPRSRSKEEPGPESMTSPKSLGAYSTSQFYYG